MDTVREKVRQIVSGLPEGASVTLPRKVLAGWLEDGAGSAETAAQGRQAHVADLTVEEIAEALEQAASTVRGWMPDVRGSYKIGGRWRISRRDWRAYLDGLADQEDDGPPEVRSNRRSGLDDWRKEREDVA